MFIESDAAIAEVITYILTDAGYTVWQTSPEGFFEDILQLQPDIILVDHALNAHDSGQEICSTIKTNIRTAQIPLILTSTMPYLADIAAACRADDTLAKPFNIWDLERVITKWVAA